MTDPLVCFREFLATKGKVLTPERELIAVTALDFDQPIEAERTVFALQKGSKRTVRRSVVYRTLADLQEAGLIQLQEDQPG